MDSNNYILVSRNILQICKPEVYLRLKVQSRKLKKAPINDRLHVSKVS